MENNITLLFIVDCSTKIMFHSFHNMYVKKFEQSIITKAQPSHYVLAVPFLYFFSANWRMVFICHVDLWTISKAKSPTRNSTSALLGTIYSSRVANKKSISVYASAGMERNFCPRMICRNISDTDNLHALASSVMCFFSSGSSRMLIPTSRFRFFVTRFLMSCLVF